MADGRKDAGQLAKLGAGLIQPNLRATAGLTTMPRGEAPAKRTREGPFSSVTSAPICFWGRGVLKILVPQKVGSLSSWLSSCIGSGLTSQYLGTEKGATQTICVAVMFQVDDWDQHGPWEAGAVVAAMCPRSH